MVTKYKKCTNFLNLQNIKNVQTFEIYKIYKQNYCINKEKREKYPQHITNEHSRLLTYNNIVERLDVSLNTVTSFKNYIERRRPDIRKPS